MMLVRSAHLLGGLAASVLCAGIAPAQQSNTAQARTTAIVASFNKSKHVSKEKRGVRKEKYIVVRSEPAVKQNPAEYSGSYDALGLDGFSVQLTVDPSGKVYGGGREPLNDDGTVARNFVLRDGWVTGAWVKARKVYSNGSAEPFEGVFINKTVFESPTDKGHTAFGLGVVGKGFRVGGVDLERVFFQSRQ